MADKKLEDLSILFIDDDSFMLDVVSQLLWKLGITQVETTESVAHALDFVRTQGDDIDVILCDLHMPESNGIEFLLKLSTNGYKGHFAILSGAMHETIEMAQELADLHGLRILGTLTKPVHEVEIKHLLTKAIA